MAETTFHIWLCLCLVGIWTVAQRSHSSDPYRLSKRDCYDSDKTLELLEQLSEVVLTGTVTALAPEPNDHTLQLAVVRIKRVIKGLELLGRMRHRRRLTVYGLGDPTLCDSVAKVHDTKIFLLHQNFNGDWTLNASLMPISLRNLDAVEAAVRGRIWDSY